MNFGKRIYQSLMERCRADGDKPVFEIMDSRGGFAPISARDLIKRIDYYVEILEAHHGKTCLIYHELDLDLLSFVLAAFYCRVVIMIRRTTYSPVKKDDEDVEFVRSIVPADLLYTDIGLSELATLSNGRNLAWDFIQLSSGTTDTAKGYCLTLEGLIESATHIQSIQHVDVESVFFSYLTLSHIYGFVSGFLLPLISGSTGLLCPTVFIKQDPSLFFKILSEKGVTHTSAIVGTLLDGLKAKREGWDLNCVKCVSLGGEKIDVSVYRALLEDLAKLHMSKEALVNSYGMSEKGSITMEDPLIGGHICTKNDEEYVSVGSASYSSTEVAVFDDDMNFLQNGNEGRVGIKSPYLARFYYQKENVVPLEQICVDGKEWYLNGDCGFIDSGRVYVTGRQVNTLVFNGLKTPAEIVNARISKLALSLGLDATRVFCFNYPKQVNFVVCLLDGLDEIDEDIAKNIGAEILTEFHIRIADFWATHYDNHGLGKISLPDVVAKYDARFNGLT